MKFEQTGEKASPEQEKEPLYQAECIVVPGHSIERVDIGDKEKWKPTRLIQGVNEKGWRIGKRNIDLDKDSDRAIVGGGNAVTLAAAQYYETLTKEGVPPKLVIFSAGRAAYLDEQAPEDPELCEAIPMVEKFTRATDVLEELGEENIQILNKTKTTRDDVEQSVELAHSRGLKKIAFLLLDLRLARAEAFWQQMKELRPDLADMEVRFLAAEDFLRERYKDHPEIIDKILADFKSSTAYDTTDRAEKGGTEAVRQGDYKGKGRY